MAHLNSSPLISSPPITNQAYISIHHLAIGLVSISAGILASRIKIAAYSSWHYQLSVNLAILGSISIFFAHHISAMPTVYPMLSSDYPSLVSLFSHHINIGALFIIGSAAHTSIFIIRDYSFQVQYQVQQAAQADIFSDTSIQLNPVFIQLIQGIFQFISISSSRIRHSRFSYSPYPCIHSSCDCSYFSQRYSLCSVQYSLLQLG